MWVFSVSSFWHFFGGFLFGASWFWMFLRKKITIGFGFFVGRYLLYGDIFLFFSYAICFWWFSF